ncbi:MAG TPA: hypothetical protein VMT54_08980 [Candidatus Cybelea sp.]|nr:hypothetical protein [Candidatus Cybelea sp.]
MAINAVGAASAVAAIPTRAVHAAAKTAGVGDRVGSAASTIAISKVTTTNPDGSTTTVTTYADGHTKTTTSPPKPGSHSKAAGTPPAPPAGGTQKSAATTGRVNLLA